MALPAGQQSDNTETILNEIKERVSLSLMSLMGISFNTSSMAASLNTIEAKAELDFEQMEDAKPEEIGADPDGAKVSDSEGMTSDDALKFLAEIQVATRLTAQNTKVLAMAAKEKGENVLKPTDPIKVDPKNPKTTTTGGDGDDEKLSGFYAGLAAVLGGIIGTIGGIFGGWFKALRIVFNRGFIKTLGTTFANFFKNLKMSFKGGALSKGFARIGSFFKSIGDFFKSTFKIVSKIGTFFKTVIGVASKVAAVVSKLFAPLLIFLGLIETVKGFFDGFINTEGSFIDKLLGGIGGAITGFLDFLIAAPLNLIKGLIGWIAGLLGFEGVKEKLESFDFSFGGIIDAVMGIIKFVGGIALKILKFPIALAAGIAGGIAALLPGGLSPKEGFMKGFNLVMGGGDEPKAPEIGDAEVDATKMGGDNNDDGTDANVETKEGPSSTSSSSDSPFPFKLKGIDKINDKYGEETTVLGESEGKYIVQGGKLGFTAVEDPKVSGYIKDAIDGNTTAQQFGLQPGETVDISGRTVTGTNISEQSSDLEAQRAEYAGGFMNGPVIAPVTTSSSSVNNSSSLTQVVAGADDSLNGRMAASSGIDPN